MRINNAQHQGAASSGRLSRSTTPWILVTIVTACLFLQASVLQAVDLSWGRMKANKILFLGNSICLHPAYQGWPGGFGMAASAIDKDYVHLLTSKIDTATGGSLTLKPMSMDLPRWYYGDPLLDIGDANILNIADLFERNFNTWDNARFQQQIAAKPDIVVLQFGENMANGTLPELKTALEVLLAGLKNSSNPQIFITSHILGSNPDVDAIKQQVCAEDPTHRTFVSITNVPGGDFGHPGDAGMAVIADTIYGAMATQAAVPEPSSWILLTTGALALAAGAWRK